IALTSINQLSRLSVAFAVRFCAERLAPERTEGDMHGAIKDYLCHE
ncbi:hypothetical protein TSAR_015924, partial [Trichomalopsis sarcophagae]